MPRAKNLESLLEICNSAVFLSFNYTDTLLKTYNVKRENIFFPHGFIGDDKPELVLGHAWTPKNEYGDNVDENTDVRVAEGLIIIDDYFKSTFKPADKIIEQNSGFFGNLSNIEKVFVLGHALHEVDHLYFTEMIKQVSKNAIWTVSYYGDDLVRIESELEALGVERDKIRMVTLPSMKKNA